MEQQYNYLEEQPVAKKGSIITGLIGALLGALVGAAVWAAVGIFLDLIAGVVGFLIGFLAAKGYDLLKGRQGWAKLVCVILAVVIGVAVGTGATVVWVLHDTYTTQIAELTDLERRFYDIMTEEEYILDNITNNPEFMGEVLKNLGIGLLFAALGCYSLLKEIVAKPQAVTAPTQTIDLSAAQVPAQNADEQSDPTNRFTE